MTLPETKQIVSFTLETFLNAKVAFRDFTMTTSDEKFKNHDVKHWPSCHTINNLIKRMFYYRPMENVTKTESHLQ